MIGVLRIATSIALLVVGCVTQPLEVESFDEIPGFTPYEQYVIWVNRKIPIMSEGSGSFTTGARFYYIAYLTQEEVVEPEPGSTVDPLWGEMQALWKVKRDALDPAEYALAVLDARVFPGTPGSKTRRAVYASRDGRWQWDQVASVVFEGE